MTTPMKTIQADAVFAAMNAMEDGISKAAGLIELLTICATASESDENTPTVVRPAESRFWRNR